MRQPSVDGATPLAVGLADHAAARSPRAGHRRRRGSGDVAEHLRPGVRAQRRRHTASSLMSQTYAIAFEDLNFGQGYALSLLATVTTIVAVAAGRADHLPEGRVLMRAAIHLRLAARCSASPLLLLWSLFPVYWALNTSLMTNSRGAEQPRPLLPHPLRVQQLRGGLRLRPVERLDGRRHRPSGAQLHRSRAWARRC